MSVRHTQGGPSRLLRSVVLIWVESGLLGWNGAQAGPAPDRGGTAEVAPPKRYALLVGCSEYRFPALPDLWGPVNDVPLWAETLVIRFGFAREDVRLLVGWPDDVLSRPTRANIVAAAEWLIAGSRPGDLVLILLTGHGARSSFRNVRDGPPDPAALGWGGTGAFLPADATPWTPAGIENAIGGDEIGSWLERLQSRGADVWIIFDVCYAAGIARPPRAVPEGAMGSVVAYYACQADEEAPELPRPAGAEHIKKNYHSLFSYHLIAALVQSRSLITYRELAGKVRDRYQVERPGRPPMITTRGDLDHRVLGLAAWPEAPEILLSRDSDSDLTVNAGELQGLHLGSLLVVHPPPGDPRPHGAILGHVRVKRLGSAMAAVEPITINWEKSTIQPYALPSQAICKVAGNRFGRPGGYSRASLCRCPVSPTADVTPTADVRSDARAGAAGASSGPLTGSRARSQPPPRRPD